MTKRNPNQRNLGPVLALTGAGIAIAAVIAGFIAVGGPGDARERRLDGITMNRISAALSVVQCAFNATGAVPATIEEAANTRAKLPTPQSPPPLCKETSSPANDIIKSNQPAVPGDVSYQPTGGAGVSLCGNFRRPHTAEDRQAGYYPMNSAYPQLDEAHPAGIHCFNIELIPAG